MLKPIADPIIEPSKRPPDKSSPHQPTRAGYLLQEDLSVGSPRQRLHECPPSGTLAIKTERLRKAIQTLHYRRLARAKLGTPNDRSKRELSLAGQWLRIDHKPRLAPCTEDVPGVEVLMHEHLLALGTG